MKEDEVINFKIDRLDPLGQGVSKSNNKITFIPKTLPGESGTAKITGKKKGIFFAQVLNLSHPSQERISPECPHFSDCSGCDYLHLSYERELNNKLESFQRQINYSPFKDSKISCHGAPARLGYRNRIQLHYDIKSKQLGFFQGRSKKIVEVPNCQLPSFGLKKMLRDLYLNDNWIDRCPPNAPPKGHLELFETDQSIGVSWNESYSSGGFTQVNRPMNELALELWSDFYELAQSPKTILDVFGGSGNLSKGLINSKVTVVDSFCNETLLGGHQSFTKVDLYKNPPIPSQKVDLLMFDPPRSGFKETSKWIDELNPSFVGYQSCFSDTMIRDLKNIGEQWEVVGIHLLDFFPSTHHYEALIFLKNGKLL